MTTTAPEGRPLKPARAQHLSNRRRAGRGPPGALRRAPRASVTRDGGVESGKRGHERRPVGGEVEERREPKHDEPLPRQLVDLVPDVSVVRDARQCEREHRADDSDGDKGADDPRASRAALPARLVELGADELVFGRGDARIDLASRTVPVEPCSCACLRPVLENSCLVCA